MTLVIDVVEVLRIRVQKLLHNIGRSSDDSKVQGVAIATADGDLRGCSFSWLMLE